VLVQLACKKDEERETTFLPSQTLDVFIGCTRGKGVSRGLREGFQEW
jgi:hypothetical protein